MKRFISLITSVFMTLNLLFCIPIKESQALSSKIENALQWAVDIANDDSYWYASNPDYRYGPNYDCSSLVFYALKNSGIDVGNSPFTTFNMTEVLTSCGFKWISWNELGGYSNLQRGDILVYNYYGEWGHTEMCLGGGKAVSADNDYDGIQVRTVWEIETYVYGEPWDGVLRYTGENNPPTISEPYISDLDDTGYTVNCTVNDDSGIERVQFPTWTTENGQDDIIWGTGIQNGNKYSYRVNISDHNNEKGGYLVTVQSC